MNSIMSMKNIKKEYIMGEGIIVSALKDVDLDVFQNDFLGVLGPSGSGKSTMLHIMGLLDSPSSGTLTIGGIETSKMTENQRAKIRGEKIGFVFQTFNLINSLTALENVELPLVLRSGHWTSRKEKAKKILESVGLGDRLNHTPGQLSGGQRQRVAIARALVNDPEIILADEPTGNLDSKTGSEVLKIFEDLHSQGKTIIIITHDQNIAKHTKRFVQLKDGRIL